MKEIIEIINDFIRIDFLIGFGVYSILFYVYKLFKFTNKRLNVFDLFAVKLVIYTGILFAVLWFVDTIIYYFQIDDNDKRAYLELLFGHYSFVYWVQPMFWLVLTQLLRIKTFNSSFLYRIIMSLLFVLTFERIDIISNMIVGNHLSEDLEFGVNTVTLFVMLLMKGLTFVVITGLIFLIKHQKSPLTA